MTEPEGVAVSTGAGLAVVVNPSAGSGHADDVTDDLRTDLPDAELIAVDDDTPIGRALERAAEFAVIGVIGGDGSINAAAERALEQGRPLAVFPGGTLNHFARDLGIDEMGATVAALRGGHVESIDVGLIDGKPFLNTASFGSYAEFVDAREKLERRLGKWAAAVVAIARVLRQGEPTNVELDGKRRQVWMIFIGNCTYEPPDLAPAGRARLDDGLFDVRYVDGSPPWSRTRLLAALVTRRLSRTTVYRRTLVESLDIHSFDGPLRLARDGETFNGGTDVRITKHESRLVVYAPRRR
jgi:diacylglycerol kinase family enzyme